MRIKRMAVLLVALALTTACTAPDNRVAELIEKGRERFKEASVEIADVTIEEEIAIPWAKQCRTSLCRTMAKGALARIDSRFLESEPPEPPESGLVICYQSEPNSYVFDGESIWYVSATGYRKVLPATGASNRIKPEEVSREMSSPRDYLEFSLTSPRSAGADEDPGSVTGLWPEWLEPEGKFLAVEEVSGRPCCAVEMPPSTRTPCEKVWIDVETLHLARAKFGGTDPRSYSTTFEDWRELAPGMWLPFSQETTATPDGTEHVFRQRIRSVEVNTGLSDEFFDPRKIKVPEPPDRSESSE